VDGRPIRSDESYPTEDGNLIYPSALGGATWYSPAYSRLTDLFYIPYRAHDHIFYKEDARLGDGRAYTGGRAEPLKGGKNTAALKAIDWRTGAAVWEVGHRRTSASGVLATAGGLVLTGSSEGDLIALDAFTGDQVWRFGLGGSISMGPITFSHAGRQEVAVISGNSLVVFGLEP
jgi:alcohol dehydrogenase (cytochrome c)